MEWMPAMKPGWLNGWLMLIFFYLVFSALMLVFPKEIVAKLYRVSGWAKEHRLLWFAGKPFSLACLGITIITPLKIGQGVFIFRCILSLLGFTGMLVALFNYRNTPADQPVTQGVYQISRNPQWMSLATMFLGTSFAIGSWTAAVLLLIAAFFYHFRILGEEKACLDTYGEPYANYLRSVHRYFLFI
jgi:protein-S-isoprenylcysteine O-methyltransferase Ste14